jgi:hypothetical protein
MAPDDVSTFAQVLLDTTITAYLAGNVKAATAPQLPRNNSKVTRIVPAPFMGERRDWPRFQKQFDAFIALSYKAAGHLLNYVLHSVQDEAGRPTDDSADPMYNTVTFKHDSFTVFQELKALVQHGGYQYIRQWERTTNG